MPEVCGSASCCLSLFLTWELSVIDGHRFLCPAFAVGPLRCVAGLWQIRRTHEVFIHTAGGLAAFGDGPDNQGLAAAHIACAENPRNAGHVVLICKHVASWVDLETELFDHAAFLRSQKAQG